MATLLRHTFYPSDLPYLRWLILHSKVAGHGFTYRIAVDGGPTFRWPFAVLRALRWAHEWEVV